jgi:transposase
MAPTTRRNLRITPPPGPSEGQEANTVRKPRFYNAWDREHENRSMRAICKDYNITEGTGRLWKKQREELGSLAYRHTRKLSSNLGRRSKVTKAVCKMLVSLLRNQVRNQLYNI